MALDVWIDTDPAVGVPDADVDDGFALLQAFRSPELSVRGVSAVFGNTLLASTLPIAREIVQRFGPPGICVHGGAASAADLGADSPAVAALAAALREQPLDVLALGPVTNVATLVQRHPSLCARIGRVVCVAGRRSGQVFRSTPSQPKAFPDLNFECDPAAMQVLLDSPVELVLAGWEVASHVWLDADDLDRLAAAGGGAAWLAERARPWLAFWARELGASGFNPFDTLAVGLAAAPALVRTVPVGVAIEHGAERPQLVVRPGASDGRRATYGVEPMPTFKADLLHRLGVGAA